MSHRVLLVEHASRSTETDVSQLLSPTSGFGCEYVDWEALLPERLQHYAVGLIVAVTEPVTNKVMQVLQWLRAHPIATPTLAVLPEAPTESLLQIAAATADDLIFSPLRAQEFRHRVARILGPDRDTVESVQRKLIEEMGLSQLVGEDPVFSSMVNQLPSIARSNAPVLITGETGTGKELCARAIHHFSKRRNFPFIALDCGAVPDHLFENEFFGHARGAFTDAHRDQKGLLAMAEGGTLLLDEVDALSSAAQVKLLRVLQERTFRPLGADRFQRADVNVLAATSRDLESLVRDKQFRSDLYFRLNVLQVSLPPLRDRRGDVTLLACHFLEALNKGDPTRKSFSASALRTLTLHAWPGNVRELLNVVHRAKVACDGAQILPRHVTLPCAQAASEHPPVHFRAARAAAVEAFERRYVEDLLRKHRGNVTHAAREAHQDRRAFGRLVKKRGIDPRAL